jgi:hypothetical protein
MSLAGRTTSRTSQRSDVPTSSRLHGERSSKGMVSVMDHDRSRSRKDRTFIGGECAVCEEQLELTLRGERILQLSCGHIAHEACFYEYLREIDSHSCPTCDAPLGLDSSRGGSVPNIGTYCTYLPIYTTDVWKTYSAMPSDRILPQGREDTNKRPKASTRRRGNNGQ